MRLPRPSGLPLRIPHKWWLWLKLPGRYHVRKPAPFWVWRSWRLGHQQKPIEMFDDVNVSLIPVGAEAVAGYVDGKWPTYAQLVKKFPHAQHIVSIAVFASDDADALDIEPGDATVAQATDWVKRQHARGEKRPILYTSVSWAPELVSALTLAGFKYSRDYLLWTAHYTGKPHLCSAKCWPSFQQIAHATQWTDRAGGQSLDESLASAEFFNG